MLNEYFEVIVKEVIQEEGVIDKFIGDAVMAVFHGEQHLARALDACLAARDAIAALTPYKGEIEYQPQVSIGVNCGELISGNIGSASLKRLDFTVIGNVVNTAQRLQSASEPGQVLILDDAYHMISEQFECKRVGEINMKNKKDPALVYEVVS